MSVSSGTSFILSSILSVLLFSGMQMYRHWLAASPLQTIFGGYLASILFVLILTITNTFHITLASLSKLLNGLVLLSKFALNAYFLIGYAGLQKKTKTCCKLMLYFFNLEAIGNIEATVFGKGFQTKLFPEVILCLAAAVSSAGMIHRVCTTTCVLFSLLALYYMNKISQQAYTVPVVVQPTQVKKKKGN